MNKYECLFLNVIFRLIFVFLYLGRIEDEGEERM